jgi:hypothetical protein
MSPREQLHQLVDRLSDEEAAAALALLQAELGQEPAGWPPAFFGMLHSGQPDLAARSGEILRAEFGRS